MAVLDSQAGFPGTTGAKTPEANARRSPVGSVGGTTPGSVTGVLRTWRDGDTHAIDRLMPLVYSELRRLAQERLGSERTDHTLEATELVHEAYLRLSGKDHPRWRDRSHFFAVAALVMRRVLIDHARRKCSLRRGGDWRRIPLEEGSLFSHERAAELVAIDGLLDELASFDPRKNRIIWMRFFGGLSIEETAKAMGISPMTVVREFRLARAWLLRELSAGGASS